MNNPQQKNPHHILPLSLYLSIGTALLLLTGLTVWTAQHDFGSINLLVAMIIAATKASLVALFFMHLKYDNKLYLLAFLSAIVFLAVFIIITMFDTMHRGDIEEFKAHPINKEAVIYNQKIVPDSIDVVVDSLKPVSDTIPAMTTNTGN